MRKPVTKKAIWVWLSFAGRAPWANSAGRGAGRRTEHNLQEKTSQGHALEPQWGSRRVRLQWEREPTARGARSESCPCCLHYGPRMRRAGASSAEWGLQRRAPSSVPNTAPDPPLPPGSTALRERGGTQSRHLLNCGAVESFFLSPDVKQAKAEAGG